MERKVFDVLKIIQTFEPDGVGARDLKECLLLQVAAAEFEDQQLQQDLTILLPIICKTLGMGKWKNPLNLGLDEDSVEGLLIILNITWSPTLGPHLPRLMVA